jgi:hypothetical protein
MYSLKKGESSATMIVVRKYAQAPVAALVEPAELVCGSDRELVGGLSCVP